MIDRQQLRREFEAMEAALARRGADVVAEDSAWARVAELDSKQRELKESLHLHRQNQCRPSQLQLLDNLPLR